MGPDVLYRHWKYMALNEVIKCMQRGVWHFHIVTYISDVCTGIMAYNVQGGTEWTELFPFVVQVLYFNKKTRKYDNVRVAPKTLVKAVLNVSSSGCNER